MMKTPSAAGSLSPWRSDRGKLLRFQGNKSHAEPRPGTVYGLPEAASCLSEGERNGFFCAWGASECDGGCAEAFLRQNFWLRYTDCRWFSPRPSTPIPRRKLRGV